MLKQINSKGLTLIEVLVSLAIFLIVTTFLAYTITSVMRNNFRNSLRDMATTILNNKMNELKTMDYDSDNFTRCTNKCTEYYTYYIGKEDKENRDDTDNITYTITWSVDELNFPTLPNKIKRIDISVEWFRVDPRLSITDSKNRKKEKVSAIFYKTRGIIK